MRMTEDFLEMGLLDRVQIKMTQLKENRRNICCKFQRRNNKVRGKKYLKTICA